MPAFTPSPGDPGFEELDTLRELLDEVRSAVEGTSRGLETGNSRLVEECLSNYPKLHQQVRQGIADLRKKHNGVNDPVSRRILYELVTVEADLGKTEARLERLNSSSESNLNRG